MKPLSFRLATVLLASLACQLLAPRAHAAGQCRADYRNLSSAQAATQTKNPGLAFFSGYIKGSQTQNGANTVVLKDCAFGQVFSQWFPDTTYGSTIVASVTTALYPNTSVPTTRTAIQNSTSPFRYKYLLFDQTGTDVTTVDTTNMATWFTQADRNAIYAQIATLKTAIAASPLDTSLRNLFLDIYFDLAVAEMQSVKPLLATLAKYRLGLTPLPTGKFIIDQEIDTYVQIDAGLKTAIAQFSALLSTPFPDIDPSSIDSRVAFGTPMGQYIFRREQSHRSSTPTQYASSTGVAEVPVNGMIVTPGTLFEGYKDLKALLDLTGQRLQCLADLSRLRGTRQAAGDVAFARQSISEGAGSDNTDMQIIKSWFPELFPPDVTVLSQAQVAQVNLLQEHSGVLASLSALEAGRIDLLSLTGFLNGSRNVLGYDPSFLLLAQDNTNPNSPRESYDVLRDLLKGNNAPLTVALNKLGTVLPPAGAIGLYNSFVEKVDQVAGDIDNADSLLDARWYAITGYAYGAGFNFLNLNPTAGSELGGVLATITSLGTQINARKAVTANFDDLLKVSADKTKAGYAQQSITLAQDKVAALDNAVSMYKNTTGPLFDSTTAAKTKAAISQASFDTISAAASAAAGSSNPIGGAVAATAIVGAGIANIIIQGETAQTIAQNDKQIDSAAVDLSAATSKADVAQAVNQGRVDLAGLKRDQIANNMADSSDIAAFNQATAQKAALLAELGRIQQQRDSTVASIRKKSYADPMHYQRADAALLDADESFRTAQRWMFYTLQALNYKWHGQFAATQGTKSYDTSSVFKARNAQELDDLLTQMNLWDQARVTQTTSSPTIYTKVSLSDHLLARNPRRFSPTDPSDPGTRADDTVTPPATPLHAVSTQQYFQKVLVAKYKEAGSGDLVIPFSTVFPNQAPDRVDGNFFRGAEYDAAGTCTSQGFWREKIQYVKVNIIADNALSTPSTLSGALTYGGTCYFHTRVPPRSDRTVASNNAIDDAPGEFLVSPFRYWVSPDFSTNFMAQSEQIVSIAVGYSQGSAFVGGTTPDNLSTSFQVNAYTGRSIAASGWKLRIGRIQSNGLVIDASHIKDIEIIVAYKHSDRVFPQ